MPRTSKCLSLFVLAGIGLPVTSLFWNNFLIISEIFNYNLILGIMVMLSLFMVALSLLEELYRMKDKSNAASACILGADLPNLHFAVYIGCLLILFFSFLSRCGLYFRRKRRDFAPACLYASRIVVVDGDCTPGHIVYALI